MNRTALTAISVIAVALLPHVGRAQQTVPRAVDTDWREGAPRVSFTYADLFDADTLQRMRSGLSVTAVMRVWVYPDGSRDAVGFAVRSCQIAYEVWDENYRVNVVDSHGEQTLSLADEGAVIRTCGAVRDLPLRMFRPLRTDEHLRIAALGEIDPVTPDMVTRIQRWVANPGETSDDARGGNFFDGFVSLFVTPDTSEAARSLEIEPVPIVAP